VNLAGIVAELERLALMVDRDVGQRGLPQHAASAIIGQVDHDPADSVSRQCTFQ